MSAGVLGPRAEPRTHGVQLYGSDDAALVIGLARYVTDGLARGEGVLVITTTTHWGALLGRLRRESVDIAHPVRDGTLVFLPAEGVLARLVKEGRPRWASFEALVGTDIRRLRVRAEPSGVRVFGEVVGLLWQQGLGEAALELEGLWNRLLATDPFQLACAYPIEECEARPAPDALAALLRAHTHRLPGAPPGAQDAEPGAGCVITDGEGPPDGDWSEVGRWTVTGAASLAAIRHRVAAAARPGGGTRRLSLRRRLVEDDGEQRAAPLTDAAGRLAVVCGELTANALCHGRRPITVTLARGEHSWLLVVSDRAAASHPLLRAPDLSAGGQIGMHLVTAVSERVGWHVSAAAKHVWAEVGDRPPDHLRAGLDGGIGATARRA